MCRCMTVYHDPNQWVQCMTCVVGVMQQIGMQEEEEEEFMTNDILKGKSNSLSRDAGADQS